MFVHVNFFCIFVSLDQPNSRFFSRLPRTVLDLKNFRTGNHFVFKLHSLFVIFIVDRVA